VEAAFEIGEAYGDGLDSLLLEQSVRVMGLELIGCSPLEDHLLGLQVLLFELIVGDFEIVLEKDLSHNSALIN
jgi:hypothetical protein